ncbi:MAG: hypothetical protein KKF30_07485 [Proteobacteria bacterium]|nr:hypothetical protein [Pseudomonadota bacterium]MBU4470290.1 hypothetical protein [Pseudomonadota bacterium]
MPGLSAEYEAATNQSVSVTAIKKHFKSRDIPRDLRAKIQAQANAKVSASMVSDGKVPGKVSGKSERTIIEENAELIAGVIISHRQDIPLKRELVSKLFAEVEAMTDNSDMMEQLLEALEKEDNTLLASVAHKIISLPQRIKGVADLVTAYKSLIGLEREAFGLNDPGVTDPNAPDAISVTFRRASQP